MIPLGHHQDMIQELLYEESFRSNVQEFNVDTIVCLKGSLPGQRCFHQHGMQHSFLRRL